MDTGFDCSGCNLVFYLFFKRQDYGPGGHYSGVFGKMNKRGDEHWGTISTLVLIFIAMIVIFFVYIYFFYPFYLLAAPEIKIPAKIIAIPITIIKNEIAATALFNFGFSTKLSL